MGERLLARPALPRESERRKRRRPESIRLFGRREHCGDATDRHRSTQMRGIPRRAGCPPWAGFNHYHREGWQEGHHPRYNQDHLRPGLSHSLPHPFCQVSGSIRRSLGERIALTRAHKDSGNACGTRVVPDWIIAYNNPAAQCPTRNSQTPITATHQPKCAGLGSSARTRFPNDTTATPSLTLQRMGA